MATGSFPTSTMNDTTLANIIPEIWSDKMNNYYREKLVCANFFTDLSADVADGGDTVYIPNVTAMAAHDKADASPVTVNANTDGEQTLSVVTKKESSFSVEEMDGTMLKKSYNYINMQAQNAAYEVGKVYEKAFIALFDDFSQTTGTSSLGVADSNIRASIKYLDDANVPQEDRVFFMSPKAVWTDLMAIDRFSLVQNTGGADPVLKGHVGMLYGIPVISHSEIGTTNGSAQNCLAGKDAIVHANTGLKVVSNFVPRYLSTLTTAYMRYGVAQNRDTSGVWIATKA